MNFVEILVDGDRLKPDPCFLHRISWRKYSSSENYGLQLSIARSNPRTFRRQLERELRFIAETREVFERLKRLPLQTTTIIQFYIKRSNILRLLRHVERTFEISTKNLDREILSSARLRRNEITRQRVRGDLVAHTSYELTLKSKKLPGKARIEQTLSLSRSEFEHLLSLAGRSTMEKTRISTSASVISKRTRFKVKLDIDVVTRCGSRKHRDEPISALQLCRAPYCFVEVEVLKDEHLKLLSEAVSRLPFWSIAAPIRSGKGIDSRPLSMSSLAKTGWNAEALLAAKRLMSAKSNSRRAE